MDFSHFQGAQVESLIHIARSHIVKLVIKPRRRAAKRRFDAVYASPFCHVYKAELTSISG